MEKIKEMSIDLETYSDVDIKKSGVYKYAESENFEILLFAVSINGDDVIVYDLACGDVLPDEILDAIVSDDVRQHIIDILNRYHLIALLKLLLQSFTFVGSSNQYSFKSGISSYSTIPDNTWSSIVSGSRLQK